MKQATSLSDLEAALDYVATMVSDRIDGESYIPLFDRLEREVEAAKAQQDSRARARARALKARATAEPPAAA